MFSYEYCEVFQKILFKEYYRWLLLYFHLMTYISVKLMTYIFNIKYFVSLSCISSFFFSLLVLKHVKLIAFENYNECETKHLFLIKKIVTRFDKKIATWRKKSIGEEKNLLLRNLKKKTLSLRTQRRPYN